MSGRVTFPQQPQIDWFKENPQMAVYLVQTILNDVINDRMKYPFSLLRQKYRKSVITA